MTVIEVNTGKFTGSGGNLEETVTRNNLEAAEEIIRQLRLRDIGGIIVIDFIDMVLESNRDLVLRRLTECLGRDRTRHQVAEVTSLGLVQMTRKKVGTGLLEAYSSVCEHCKGRGVLVSAEPVSVRGQLPPPAPSSGTPGGPAREASSTNGRRSRSRGRGSGATSAASEQAASEQAVTPDPSGSEVAPGSAPPDGAGPVEPVVAEQATPAADTPSVPTQLASRAAARRRRAASRPAGPPEAPEGADAREVGTPV
jgi:ribonuclease E